MNVLIRRTLRFLPIYLLLMIINTACVSFRESDNKVFRKFKKTSVTPKIYRTPFEDREMRYIAAAKIDAAQPSIFFIHGAPGSAGNYFRFLKDTELAAKANLISVDRLGYGYSGFGTAETSIKKQAESIYAIAEFHNLKKIIVMGWSYGAPIAVKMAYLFPEVKHSVLLAGALSPQHEKYFAIAKMARWKLTKWMVPMSLKMADAEKQVHANELTRMLSEWPQIQSPITYYHGTKDHIVPFENMSFIKANAPESILNAVTLENSNHFILSKKYDLIKNQLISIIEGLD